MLEFTEQKHLVCVNVSNTKSIGMSRSQCRLSMGEVLLMLSDHSVTFKGTCHRNFIAGRKPQLDWCCGVES